MQSIFDIARLYAIGAHAATNHMYDDKHPYGYHLKDCDDVALAYIHLIPEEDRFMVRAAIQCHDVIEDARQSYNDVVEAVGVQAADIVFAVTDETGKTRKERHNEKYFSKIRNTPYAVFVKLCDRIANAKYSRSKGIDNKMYKTYVSEAAEFTLEIYDDRYDEMFTDLNIILGFPKK